MASQDVEETVIQCGVQTSPHSKPILVLTASHAEAEGQTGLAKGCSSNDASTTAADAQPRSPMAFGDPTTAGHSEIASHAN